MSKIRHVTPGSLWILPEEAATLFTDNDHLSKGSTVLPAGSAVIILSYPQPVTGRVRVFANGKIGSMNSVWFSGSSDCGIELYHNEG